MRSVSTGVALNRTTRVATSVSVTITQGDRPWLVATVWGVGGVLGGLDHHTAAVPDVDGPDGLPTTAELMEGREARTHRFWYNLEQRPRAWIADWENRTASEPSVATWDRFVPTSTFEDPCVDACRSLILVDLDS